MHSVYVFFFFITINLLCISFDVFHSVIAYVIIALRTLRTLRSISFIRGLQVLVSALIQTFKSSVFYLLLLLLVLMFLFAIMGYYLFGYEDNGDKRNWGSFGQSMLSLFTFVTVSVIIAIKSLFNDHATIHG